MNQLPFTNPFYTKTIVSNKNMTQTDGFYARDNSDYDQRGGTAYSQPVGHQKTPSVNDMTRFKKFGSDSETKAETNAAPRNIWSQGDTESPYSNSMTNTAYFNKRKTMQNAESSGLDLNLSPAALTGLKTGKPRFSLQMTD